MVSCISIFVILVSCIFILLISISLVTFLWPIACSRMPCFVSTVLWTFKITSYFGILAETSILARGDISHVLWFVCEMPSEVRVFEHLFPASWGRLWNLNKGHWVGCSGFKARSTMCSLSASRVWAQRHQPGPYSHRHTLPAKIDPAI